MQRNLHPHRYCSQGFTLIEMLVVIVIITILAGISIPAIRGFSKNRRIDAGGMYIQGILNKAQTRAQKQGERQFIAFFTSLGPASLNIPGTATPLTLPINQIAVVDQYADNSGLYWDQVGSATPGAEELVQTFPLPELTEFINTPSFGIEIYPDGSCLMIGQTDSIWTMGTYKNTNNPAPVGDIEIRQLGGTQDYHCYIDVLQSSGRSRRRLWVAP
jgi:prepilin-type N-terminal cleavage/methylation domain-containing protein